MLQEGRKALIVAINAFLDTNNLNWVDMSKQRGEDNIKEKFGCPVSMRSLYRITKGDSIHRKNVEALLQFFKIDYIIRDSIIMLANSKILVQLKQQ